MRVKFLVLSLGLNLIVGSFCVGVTGLASLAQKEVWGSSSEGQVLGKILLRKEA